MSVIWQLHVVEQLSDLCSEGLLKPSQGTRSLLPTESMD